MNVFRNIIWISISSLILVISLLIIYHVFPLKSHLMLGSFPFPIKGLLTTVLLFISVWLTMFKLRTLTDDNSLLFLIGKGFLTVIIGEFIYQILSFIYYGHTSISFIIFEAIKYSILTSILGLFFSIIIAYYFKTKRLGNTIGIGFLIWFVFGLIMNYLNY